MGGDRGAGRERGAAAVEFALVAPLLLLLIFGIISYGVMLSFRQSLSQAAAEGARAAAVAPATPTDADVYGAAAQAARAVENALGDGYACADGVLRKGDSTVGTCVIATPATCTATSCPYQVSLTYDYADHPLVPQLPLVPMPGVLSYTSAAEGNA
ncbi:TadE/TadG family type IV pilus assembly protein [Nocardioides sp. DS6]|uniref:TadE/TadG family type IV pilus assembly protein n=1 Tax=Nocardioides eburneus TaxID=3231482 RepID=A0ABV3SVN4_9ACTN